jgi:hypothetical protein
MICRNVRCGSSNKRGSGGRTGSDSPHQPARPRRDATRVADILITPARAQASPGALKGYSVDVF